MLLPATGLPFVNADVIASATWPGTEAEHAYDASRMAATERSERMSRAESFITETVFSHESKVELVRIGHRMGYLIHLHVIVMPVDLCVARVVERVRDGGHGVPEDKVRERHARLWALVAAAARVADRSTFYDNGVAARPFRLVAELERGVPTSTPRWPTWTPPELLSLEGG